MGNEVTETGEENNLTELIMRFDPSTIEHLGIQMYSTLPPVIAELVSNAYDADAKKVEVHLNDEGEKSIQVIDDGHGMSFDDINIKFLKIGRNRRRNKQKQFTIQKTESGKRFAIGKKGLGKLSFFGIAKTVEVETIRDGIKNVFKLEWDNIINPANSEESYKPEILKNKESTQEPSGTKITLTNIQRKTGFDPENIEYNLAKTFEIFNENDFETKIFHNGKDERIVKNEMKFKGIDIEFEWIFPSNKKSSDYKYSTQIGGKIVSGVETVPANMKGIALLSRGKLVNAHEFYDNTASSFGYAYITGFLDVSFIDEWSKDVISTNRKSLNWEDEDARKLRDYLNTVVRDIYNDRKEKKKEKQIQEIEKVAGINIEWYRQLQLPKYECGLAKKMTDSILNSEGITTQKQAELVKYVKDSFQFEAFREFANELDSVDAIESDKLIQLMKEWELIENREMYKLAIGRIQTIEKFKKLIDSNAYEVKEIHPFFEKFPWILDPRINMFKHELQYAQILKENYPDENLEGKNRRIDFLCTSVSNHKFIIELKRPNHNVTKEDIEQAKDYRSFIEEKIPNDKFSPNKVIAYIVGGGISDDRLTKEEITTQQQADKIYVKTFIQLLEDARNYHREFLTKYDDMIMNKNTSHISPSTPPQSPPR